MISWSRRSVRVSAVLSTVALALPAACDASSRASSEPLQVSDAWSRAADSGATGVVYARITNVAAAPITIATLSSADAEQAELHESMQMNGMVHMVARPSLSIPPDSTLQLRAGGLHIMLTGLRRALRIGDSVALSISLQDGRGMTVHAAVREP